MPAEAERIKMNWFLLFGMTTATLSGPPMYSDNHHDRIVVYVAGPYFTKDECIAHGNYTPLRPYCSLGCVEFDQLAVAIGQFLYTGCVK
jgi:hypothetical protein